MISEKILVVMPFDDDNSPVWKDSSLRNYLNKIFIEEAFSVTQKARLVRTRVVQYDFKMDESNTTFDKVWIPSHDGLKKVARRTKITPVAFKNAFPNNPSQKFHPDHFRYWTITPINTLGIIQLVFVDPYGFFDSGFGSRSHLIGVRPMIRIKREVKVESF